MRWMRWAGGGAAEGEYSLLENVLKSRIGKLLWLCYRRKVVVPFLGVCVLIYAIFVFSEEKSSRLFTAFLTKTMGKSEERREVHSPGCHVPELNPWDPSILPYIKPRNINCSKYRGPPLVASNSTSLYMVHSAIPYYNTSVRCCFQPCMRTEKIDDLVKSKYCFRFSHEVRIKYEFVIVYCFVGKKKVYEDYHSFVPRKPRVEKRCEKLSPRSKSSKNPTLSVMILGLDGLSRLNFHRQMPLTVSLLKKMGAIEMLEYNKVGENTFQNLIPALTGMDVHEQTKSCLHRRWSFMDDCSFVWDEYRKAGYRTAFVEESAGGIVNFVTRGFEKQPTDYYTRHFSKAMVRSIGHQMVLDYPCSGSRLTAEVYLNYVKKFLRTFKFDRYFAFFWSTTLSHDFLNIPKLGDKMYEEFLLKYRAAGFLNRTVLAMMSDHGFNRESIRLTYQGRLEARLPFLFLFLPDWFRRTYPTAVANAERNAHRLTTHFDLHETLRDLTRTSELLSENVLASRSRELERQTTSTKGPPRGISLFLPVPSTRTCRQAGISAHFCTCVNGTAVDRNDIMYNRTVNYLVQHINQIIVSSPQCHILHVGQVYLVNQKKNSGDIGNGTAYLVVVKTKPGGAIFEGTMDYEKEISKLSVVSSVSRINLYGEQSRCVQNATLKLYCVCKPRTTFKDQKPHYFTKKLT